MQRLSEAETNRKFHLWWLRNRGWKMRLSLSFWDFSKEGRGDLRADFLEHMHHSWPLIFHA